MNEAESPFTSHICIDGRFYTEITDRALHNVRPGQFVGNDGTIYDSYTKTFRHPTISRYILTYVYFNDNSRIHIGVHRLLMLVFMHEEGCENLVVNHQDGNKHNDKLSNLEWTTTQGNNIHAIETGLNNITGENSHFAKLTKEQVEEICKELASSERYYGQYSKLAKKHDVAETTIADIAKGKQWKNESAKFNLDYENNAGVESILTEAQVREICEEISKGRYHGQNVDLGRKYGVSPSTIKEIIAGRSWASVSKDYNIEPKVNTKLSEDKIHQICQIIESYGYFNNEVYDVILKQLGLVHSSQLRHNIRRIYRKDKGCYDNITAQYNWTYNP